MRKSEAYYWPSKKLRQLEVWRKGRHCSAFRTMHPAMFLKVNLIVVRALKNVERMYLLDSNNNSGETQ